MTYSGIGIFPNGLAFIAAHELDRRLVVCKQGKSGDIETVANYHLPDDGIPVNAVPYGDSHVCVMDMKGRLWFFKISLSMGTVEQVKVLRLEKLAALQAPRCGVYLSQTATLYVSSYTSNEVWTISVKDPDKPVLVQRVTADVAEALPVAEYGSPLEMTTKQIQGPTGMAASGDGRDLYLLNLTAPSLVQFRVSQIDGTLTYSQIYDRTTIKGERRLIPHSIMLPQAVAATADGKQVYVGGLGNTIGIFNRDVERGVLTLHDVVHPKVPGFSSLKYIVALRMTLDGRGVVAACRETGSIFVLDREASGRLIVRKEIVAKGNLAFRGLSDAVATLDNEKVLFTSTGVILGAADARVVEPKK